MPFLILALAKKGARILQTHFNDLSYHLLKLYTRQLFNKLQKEDIGQEIKEKHWKKEIVQVPDWPRKSSVAVFRLTVQHDCLVKHLHRIGLRDSPFCMLCGLQEDMDRNHLQRCAAPSGTTVCERYWEARTKISTVL